MIKIGSREIKSVGFLGAGKSNAGVYEYLSRRSRDFSVTVRSSAYSAEFERFNPSRRFIGKDSLASIDEDILFISPSARRDTPELIAAKENGVLLSSDAELFFGEISSDVFAVTGSDGKSTTTYLTSKLLPDAYKEAIPCGNIGRAMSPLLFDAGENSAFVTELSSFQLNYLSPKSKRSIITNVTENHLNWHTSFDEYVNAKRNVFEYSKERIINYDCKLSRRIAKDYEIFAVFSAENDEQTLKKDVKAELYVTLDDGYVKASGEPVLKTADIKLAGRHNLLNFMSALALSHGFYKKNTPTELAKSFGGLPHRCELVGSLDGVRYYDSSIDSSPKRCAATLEMLDGIVTVILGGRSKGLDFSELVPILKKKTRRVIITGECAKEIEDAILRDKNISGASVPYTIIDDFYEAIDFAVSTAERGEAVILSPAATSHDKFINFEERGNAFKTFLKSKGI